VDKNFQIQEKIMRLFFKPITKRLFLFSFIFLSSVLGKDAVVISSFESDEALEDWVSVNDGVMGGVSEGSFERTEDETLLFKGNLSLENSGGFASIRMRLRDLDLAGAQAIVIKARGDGRTYWMDLRKGRQMGASSYRAFFTPSADAFSEIAIPISDFDFQTFGRRVAGRAISPQDIRSVGITLADKKEGPFELEIAYIKAEYEDKPGGTDKKETIPDVAQRAGSFNTLLAAVEAAGLAATFSGDGPFTVFAPTDDAFEKLPDGVLEELLKPENKSRLVDILLYHVVAGRVPLADALALQEGKTLQGDSLSILFKDGRVMVGPALLASADIEASNGVIHVIDQVLLPPEPAKAVLRPAELIELAIERGVPLFNHGSPEACAAVYEVTSEALLMHPEIADASRKELTEALRKMRETSSQRKKAWILRYALDSVLARESK
jgi:uncharacterized surface protein with fasciclin (FAS1) repeats